MTQIISNRFIEKARQSKNQYTSQSDFEATNIYNYKTYSTTMSFTRIYVFNETASTVERYGEKGETFKVQNPESAIF